MPRHGPHLVLLVLVGALLPSASLLAEGHSFLHDARDDLMKAAQSDSPSEQERDLTSALQDLVIVDESKQDQGHRSAAARYVRAALADLDNDEIPDKTKGDINQALQEVLTDISLVDHTPAPPATSTPPANSGATVVLGTNSPASAPPPVSGAAATPSTFTSLQSVADLVPQGINVKNGDDWDLNAVAQASVSVSAAKKQHAVFQVTFEKYVPTTTHGSAYCVLSPDGKLDVHGTTISSRLWVYCQADQGAALSKCQAGSTITVSGNITRSDLSVHGGRCFLSFIIENGTVLDSPSDGVSASSSPFGSPTPAPPPAAPAPPPIAEQYAPVADKPFVNSLGVKFVPAGTAGVLFSVWDVRVRDFKAYVNTTGYQAHGTLWSLRDGVYKRRSDSWDSPGFVQTENDPVVGINGDEEGDFCRWLTQKEHTDGSLAPDKEYRLPTKAEWNAAVGTTEYPWGNEWPPPPGAGNFAGSEARDADWPPADATIDGYSDGFPRTSPVGSFKPNQYGLYDIGGDVRQICREGDGKWTMVGSGWAAGTAESLRLGRSFGCSRPSRLVDLGFRIVLAASSNVAAASLTPPAPPPVTPAIAPNDAPTAKLTEDQARAVVLIKGDNAEGTGFLVKMPDGPVVMTNIHVISNNPNLQITTSTGAPVAIVSYKGAKDRDLAMISIKDGDYKYLELATDISSIVQPGDEVITPGNSEGGEVMLNTDGKVLGIGPDRIEFDNPIYHGNSGGPVFHVKSGKVIGIVTEAMKVDNTDDLDKASFANRNSAISHSMRYFGFRLDNVPGWEVYDWRQFLSETAFLDQFDQRSKCLDSYLNAPDDDKPEDTVWQQDDKIVKANSGYFDQANGGDAGQQMDAARQMWGEISDLADSGMDAIQNPNNFYSFDQQRAKDEVAYRKALKVELDQVNNNVSRLGSLPRSNSSN